MHRLIYKNIKGPNELSVCDPAAIRPIYNQLERAPFYEGKFYKQISRQIRPLKYYYTTNGNIIGTPAKADSLITVRDRLRHTERRHVSVTKVTIFVCIEC